LNYRYALFTLARLFLLCALCGLILAACDNGGGSTAGTGTAVASSPFQVTGVTMAVSPANLGTLPCGTSVTITYTATFHVRADGPGGTATFSYTTGKGQSASDASLVFTAGQSTKTYNFTWQGQLGSGKSGPGLGGVVVSSPNALTSPLVQPTGTCGTITPTPTPGPFVITSVVLTTSVNPTGPITCGTELAKQTYNVTFNIAPHGSGGTIVYSEEPDQSELTPGNTNYYDLTVDPGQTTATVSYFWEDPVSSGIVLPTTGYVQVDAPDKIKSNTVPSLVTGCH
jgi:hypothetical protein